MDIHIFCCVKSYTKSAFCRNPLVTHQVLYLFDNHPINSSHLIKFIVTFIFSLNFFPFKIIFFHNYKHLPNSYREVVGRRKALKSQYQEHVSNLLEYRKKNSDPLLLIFPVNVARKRGNAFWKIYKKIFLLSIRCFKA